MLKFNDVWSFLDEKLDDWRIDAISFYRRGTLFTKEFGDITFYDYEPSADGYNGER